jgi:DNA-binding NarL/FixJ family response regulator
MRNAGPLSTASRKARVLIIDDHPIVREGLLQLINATGDLVVCGEASTGREALESIKTSAPDIAIVDISLEDCSGVELIKEIVARGPRLPCLALSMYDETMYALRVLRAGGLGYIMKQEMPKKVLTAIRQVLAGHVYVSEKISTRLLDQYAAPVQNAPVPASALTDRELEILTLMGRGETSRDIAAKLFLSVKTIEAHRERIKKKLKLTNSAELMRYAIKFTLDAAGTKPSNR